MDMGEQEVLLLELIGQGWLLEFGARMSCRLREVYLAGDVIIVKTRIGGLNRRDSEACWKLLRENPYYIRDYDDKRDHTYAYIEYRMPDISAEKIEKFFSMMSQHERGE